MDRKFSTSLISAFFLTKYEYMGSFSYENGPIYAYFAYNVRKNADIRDVEKFLAM